MAYSPDKFRQGIHEGILRRAAARRASLRTPDAVATSDILEPVSVPDSGLHSADVDASKKPETGEVQEVSPELEVMIQELISEFYPKIAPGWAEDMRPHFSDWPEEDFNELQQQQVEAIIRSMAEDVYAEIQLQEKLVNSLLESSEPAALAPFRLSRTDSVLPAEPVSPSRANKPVPVPFESPVDRVGSLGSSVKPEPFIHIDSSDEIIPPLASPVEAPFSDGREQLPLAVEAGRETKSLHQELLQFVNNYPQQREVLQNALNNRDGVTYPWAFALANEQLRALQMKLQKQRDSGTVDESAIAQFEDCYKEFSTQFHWHQKELDIVWTKENILYSLKASQFMYERCIKALKENDIDEYQKINGSSVGAPVYAPFVTENQTLKEDPEVEEAYQKDSVLFYEMRDLYSVTPGAESDVIKEGGESLELRVLRQHPDYPGYYFVSTSEVDERYRPIGTPQEGVLHELSLKNLNKLGSKFTGFDHLPSEYTLQEKVLQNMLEQSKQQATEWQRLAAGYLAEENRRVELLDLLLLWQIRDYEISKVSENVTNVVLDSEMIKFTDDLDEFEGEITRYLNSHNFEWNAQSLNAYFNYRQDVVVAMRAALKQNNADKFIAIRDDFDMHLPAVDSVASELSKGTKKQFEDEFIRAEENEKEIATTEASQPGVFYSVNVKNPDKESWYKLFVTGMDVSNPNLRSVTINGYKPGEGVPEEYGSGYLSVKTLQALRVQGKTFEKFEKAPKS